MSDIDLIGVGAGPANLSLAALIETARLRGLINFQSTFLEKNPAVCWHSGQLFPGTLMQTEFYRDLVTPVDPTSGFSFLNYLKAHDRLDQFFCSEYICPTRREFEDYLNWVAKQLPVVFASFVSCVDYDPEANCFLAISRDGESQARYTSRHLVLGCGAAPATKVPPHENARVVHVSDLLAFEFPEPLRSILVVGSGQSAAECVTYLLERFAETGLQITWVTHETAFHALNKGNFSREAYSAGYGMTFSHLPEALREKTLREENDIAFGITPELAKALYQRLYALKHQRDPSKNSPEVYLQTNVEVTNVGERNDAAVVTARDLASNASRTDTYSCVILCTGLKERSVLQSSLIGPELKSRVGAPGDREGYAVAWDGPRDRMIFVQSENRKTHGIGDANFITAPGRNAFILNAIVGKDIYRMSQSDRLVDP